MKGTKRIVFTKHVLQRAKERNIEIRKLYKLFRKSHFDRFGKRDVKVFKKDGWYFVVADYEDSYVVLTTYKDPIHGRGFTDLL